MKHIFQLCTILIALAVSVSLPAASAGIQSNFDSGNDGWTIVDLANLGNDLGNPPQIISSLVPTWNPSGYITQGDPSSNWCMFSAPAAYLGAKSQFVSGTLSFDMCVDQSDGISWPLVVLVGQDTTLYYDSMPPTSTWTHYSVDILPGAWRKHSRTGGLATLSDIESVMGNLRGLYIEQDWNTGFETTSLDNVSLVPEPMALFTLAFGVVGLAIRSRHYNR